MIEIPGNGNVIEKEIRISSFIRLHIGIHGLAEIIQSDEEKVIVEADENLQDFFQVINSGKTLYVTSEAKLRIPVFTKLKVKIYCRQVHVLNVAGNGDVICTNPLISTEPVELKIHSQGNTSIQVKAPTVKLVSECHGNVELKGECHELVIRGAMHGDLHCKEMLADKTTITTASHGDVTLYSKEEISIKNAGHGDVHYYGDGRLKNLVHNGHGQVAHKKM